MSPGMARARLHLVTGGRLLPLVCTLVRLRSWLALGPWCLPTSTCMALVLVRCLALLLSSWSVDLTYWLGGPFLVPQQVVGLGFASGLGAVLLGTFLLVRSVLCAWLRQQLVSSSPATSTVTCVFSSPSWCCGLACGGVGAALCFCFCWLGCTC